MKKDSVLIDGEHVFLKEIVPLMKVEEKESVKSTLKEMEKRVEHDFSDVLSECIKVKSILVQSVKTRIVRHDSIRKFDSLMMKDTS